MLLLCATVSARSVSLQHPYIRLSYAQWDTADAAVTVGTADSPNNAHTAHTLDTADAADAAVTKCRLESDNRGQHFRN